jgi:hypothetical protein
MGAIYIQKCHALEERGEQQGVASVEKGVGRKLVS